MKEKRQIDTDTYDKLAKEIFKPLQDEIENIEIVVKSNDIQLIGDDNRYQLYTFNNHSNPDEFEKYLFGIRIEIKKRLSSIDNIESLEYFLKFKIKEFKEPKAIRKINKTNVTTDENFGLIECVDINKNPVNQEEVKIDSSLYFSAWLNIIEILEKDIKDLSINIKEKRSQDRPIEAITIEPAYNKCKVNLYVSELTFLFRVLIKNNMIDKDVTRDISRFIAYNFITKKGKDEEVDKEKREEYIYNLLIFNPYINKKAVENWLTHFSNLKSITKSELEKL